MTLNPTVASLLRSNVVLLALTLSNPAAAGHFKVVHSFCSVANCTDGSAPFSGLVQDPAGNVYGTTQAGGANGSGVIFQLQATAHGGWKYKVLYSFCGLANCADGAVPWGNLIVDTQGNIYGTTSAGGAAQSGAVFEFHAPARRKSPWTEEILYNFCSSPPSCTDGNMPKGGLGYSGASSGIPYDGSSPLYGTTFKGGEFAVYGIVYSLTPTGNGWSESVLYNFCSELNCSDGGQAFGTPVVDGSGNVFATASFGGANNGGVLFELSPGQNGEWTDTLLHSFCAAKDCRDGAQPIGSLTMDTAGHLFGTADDGGNAVDHGVVFTLTPNGAQSSFKALNRFCAKQDCADGRLPVAGVTLDSNGILYGTTYLGGGNDSDEIGQGGGTVFALEGSSLRILHAFCAKPACSDGSYPMDEPLVTANGHVLGVTQSGGEKNKGVIFQASP